LDLLNDKEILTCKHYGFSVLSNNPNEKELNDFYENHYRAISSPLYIPYDKNIKITQYPMRAISQITLAKSFCNSESDDYVLDLGSGYGDILIASKKILINPKLAVIELTKGAIDFFKRNYDVKVFHSLKAFSAEHAAKVIVLSHYLEHFRSKDISQLFDDLKSSLATDGVVMTEVPHVDMGIHAQYRYPDTPPLALFLKISIGAVN
jgi:SAM-dependent methyltransferase